MSWTAIIHYATVEYGTSEYDEVSVSSVAALSNYGSYSLDIIAVDETPEIGKPIAMANGSLQPSRDVRYSYAIESYPVSYATARNIVTNDVVTLAKKPYLWLELNTQSQDGTYNVGETTQYHGTDKCIPVTIESSDTKHNHEKGKKSAIIFFKRRFRA